MNMQDNFASYGIRCTVCMFVSVKATEFTKSNKQLYYNKLSGFFIRVIVNIQAIEV